MRMLDLPFRVIFELFEIYSHEKKRQREAAEQEKKHDKLSEGSIDVEFKVKEK